MMSTLSDEDLPTGREFDEEDLVSLTAKEPRVWTLLGERNIRIQSQSEINTVMFQPQSEINTVITRLSK